MKYFGIVQWIMFACIVVASGCQRKSYLSGNTKNFIVTDTSSVLINDTELYLSQSPQFTYISKDSALIVDNKGFHVYVNQKYSKTIGKAGGGTGEYKSNQSYCISFDTLFVYDFPNSKVIGYSLRTGECVFEKSSPAVAQFLATSILRHKGKFLIANTTYFSTPQNTNIFALLDDAGRLEEIPCTAKSSPSYPVVQGTIFPSYTGRIKLSASGDKFYANILFSPYAIVGDMKTLQCTTLPIELEMDKDAKVVNGKMPNIDKNVGIYPLPDGFALASFVMKEGNTVLAIRFYNHQGQKVGEIKDPHGENVLFITADEKSYSVLKLNDPKDSVPHPYSLIRKNYTYH